jgi:hypothetical protein
MTPERDVSRQFMDGMVSGSDPLPQDLADAFREAQGRLWPFARHVVFFNTISSTNDVAMKLAAIAEEGTVVVANEQTAGRGFRRLPRASMHRSFSSLLRLVQNTIE